ncbi:MAG: tRNA pseudouridine(38-40) synthase TruA [Acidimicrobiia bacterium]
MAVYRMVLGYDGAGFRGFARQREVRTVQGVVDGCLSRILGGDVVTTAAGRTDAGVHARAQVVSFEFDQEIDRARLARSLNGMLGSEVVVRSIDECPEGFNARFSATWRQYRYRILNAPIPDPFRRHLCWHVAEPLDVDPMNQAAGYLVGEHDFASFCRAPDIGSTVRRVRDATWTREGDLVVFVITASSFCHQMVRSLVGFLVDVGKGRRHPTEMKSVIDARDRSKGSNMAPPHGLILWDVGYDRDEAVSHEQ